MWDVCCHFIEHLYWYKRRPTELRAKFEALLDGHRSKPKCLTKLSTVLQALGRPEDRKRILTTVLELWRERGDGLLTAESLVYLSQANRASGLYEEGIRQVEEASEISRRFGNIQGEAYCLRDLSQLLLDDKQLDATEETAFRTIDLASKNGQEFLVCHSHQILGDVYRSKGDKEKAIHHFKKVLDIASPLNWHSHLSLVHHSLASLFLEGGESYDANIHIGQTKSYVINDPYNLFSLMDLQARIMYAQGRFEEAKSEALGALEISERLGATQAASACRYRLEEIEEAQKGLSPSEFLASINPLLAHGTL